MGSSLPVLSGREVVRVFEQLGWQVVRQRGSHIIMVKEGEIATLSVPDHREVAKGTLRSLIRSAGLTVKEFTDALEN
ncbi:MAG: type II toxin-antitoxin system HicA family toxin [Cyanobacteria bacterium J06638_22]